MERLSTFITVFLGIFLEASPFLLLGVLVSSVLDVAVSEDRLSRYFPRNGPLGLVAGVALGAAAPLCECGTVPIARGSVSKGVPLAAVVGFLLAAPIINPITIAATYTAFRADTRMVGLRIVGGVVIALIVGGLFLFWPSQEAAAGDRAAVGRGNRNRARRLTRCELSPAMSKSRLFRMLAACPSLLVALVIARLWVSGTLGYYVNARTVWIVLAGGAMFAVVGTVGLWTAARDSDPDTQLSWKTAAFLAPALVALLLPATPLSAASGQASSLGALQLASHVSSSGSGDTFGYWISSLASHSVPAWWAGQHVTLVGFAVGQIGLPPHSVIVGRYLVTCCVVDATLLGFPVEVESKSLPRDGDWVQVQGVFGHGYWRDDR